MSPDGPKEIYLIGGESVAEDGITRPDDPRVIQYLDSLLQSHALTALHAFEAGSIQLNRNAVMEHAAAHCSRS